MLSIAVALVLTALSDSVVFFYSPSDLAEKKLAADQRILHRSERTQPAILCRDPGSQPVSVSD